MKTNTFERTKTNEMPTRIETQQAISAMLDAGMKQIDIAATLKVARSTVRRTFNKKKPALFALKAFGKVCCNFFPHFSFQLTVPLCSRAPIVTSSLLEQSPGIIA